MAFDLQEQEQIDSIKAFWKQWGRWIALVLLLAIAGYVGLKGYRYYQLTQAEQASVIYQSLVKQAEAKDVKSAQASAKRLQSEYPSVEYASRAALLVAKVAFDKNDLALAQTQLEWAATHSQDEITVALAQLRLAAVLVDLKRYDAALGELGKAHPQTFEAIFLDAKGDVHVAKGSKAAARDAYKAALAKLTAESANRDVIQLKLDALGE